MNDVPHSAVKAVKTLGIKQCTQIYQAEQSTC